MTAARWLPGAGAMAAGRPLRGLLLLLLLASQVALWLWRGRELAAALDGRPLDMALAAWTSLWLALVSWISGWPARDGGIRKRGPWSALWDRLRERPATRAGLGLAYTYIAVALLAPALAPHDPNSIGDGIATHRLPPLSRLHLLSRRDGSVVAANEVELSSERIRARRGSQWIEIPRQDLIGTRPADWRRMRLHLLGTDRLGRDVLSRLLVGARVSLGVGLLSACLAVAIGALLGGIAGASGPRVDALIMRVTDAALAFPRLFLVLLVLALIPGSFTAVVVVLGATGWMAPCRLVRGQVLSLREREFVRAARSAGRGGAGILLRHLLPNAAAPLLVAGALRVGDTMLLEAGLSFLGLGVPPPHASWGNLVSGGRPALMEAWWIVTFPGLAIVGATLAFNLVGDGLRRALATR